MSGAEEEQVLSREVSGQSFGYNRNASITLDDIHPTEADVERALPPPAPPLPANAPESVKAGQKVLEDEERMIATMTAKKELLEAMREAELEASPETAMPAAPAANASGPRSRQPKQYTGTRGSLYATGVVATGYLPLADEKDSSDASECSYDETDYMWDEEVQEYVLSPAAVARGSRRQQDAAATS
jgi:hypothetical protein